MKAIVTRTYGGPEVLTYEDVPKPEPKDNEVLINVKASGVNAGDWHLLRGDPWMMRLLFGITKPKISILGVDVSGVVEAVGANARRIKPGDEVYADLSHSKFGGYAEWVTVKEDDVALKPSNLSFEQAAAVPTSAATALQAIRDHGKIAEGKRVLINGASGGVGSYSVQIAKAYGAHVTAVCSTRNVEMVQSLGADEVIDYKKEDFLANGQTYDLIHAANGYRPIAEYKKALTDGGIYIISGGDMKQLNEAMLRGPFLSMFGNKKLGNMLVKVHHGNLDVLREFIESGKVKPVLDRTFALKDAAEALRYVEEGESVGKVVLSQVPS